MMPDYQQGKIYTVRCYTDNSLIYVGSTINSLTRRWYSHKQDAERRHSKINRTMKEMGIENFYIELYELFPCNSKIELEKREGEIIRLIGTLNENIAGRDNKQYYTDNLDRIKQNRDIYYIENKEKIRKQQHQYTAENKDEKQQYDTEYREINKEKIKERRTVKIECPICKFSITKDNQARHIRTTIHQFNLKISL
jgi:hypothetical protein